jgi:hypothetical protein
MDTQVLDFQRFLAQCVDEGKTTGHWSESTITQNSPRIALSSSGLRCASRSSQQKIAPAYLPVESFAYVAFYLKTTPYQC